MAYTRFPCGANGAKCIRIDQLSIQLSEAASGVVIWLGLTENTALMPVTSEGHFAVPAGALRLTVRYGWDGDERFYVVANDERASGRLDTINRTLYIEGLSVSFEQEDLLVALSLAADLINTQPSPEIVESLDADSGRLVFTARTFDAEFDPIVHRWMIPGLGSWRGDSITPYFPAGRHAVILFADDVRRARGVTARWIDVAPPTAP